MRQSGYGWLRAAMPTGSFVRGAMTIAGGTGAAQIIAIGSSPFVTRLYTPSDYGAFAVAGSLLSVLLAVVCLRYELAIPLPRSDTTAANVLALCLTLVVAGSLLAVPILWLAGPQLLEAAGASGLSAYVLLLPLAILVGGVVAALVGWMIRTKSYAEIARTRIAQSATIAIAQIGLGALSAGAPGLLVGSIAGGVVAVGGLARTAGRRSAASFRAVSREGVRATATRYRRFPIFSAPSAFLNTLGLEAPLVLIAALYGPGTGGQFALAQRIVALPVALIAAAVGQVYFAEAARLGRERPNELTALFWSTTRTLAVIAIVPFALVAIAAPLLFGIVFGEAWREAGLYVAILAPMYYLQFVTWPTGGTLDVLERQDLHLLREICRIGLVGGAVVAAPALNLSSIGVVAAVSAAGCVTNLLYGLFSLRAINSRIETGASGST